MRGAKRLDGKRVRLTRTVSLRDGSVWPCDTEGVFRKLGVVRCVFERDGGGRLTASHMDARDFEVIDGN